MKKFSFLLHLWLLLVTVCLSASAQARSVRVFVIGNSFSGNATKYLPALAKDGGHEIVLGKAELGGHSLKQHWSYVEAAEANPEDPKGKAYHNKTKSLRELLAAGAWDVVTIQQYSLHSADVETYRPYARKLHDFVKTLQPQAEVVFHQTWAYRSDARAFGLINVAENKRAKSQLEMWENSRAAYHTIAKELGLRVIPVGDAFMKVSADPKWGYKKDEVFDFKNLVHPALPDQTNSLHVGYVWSKTGDKLNFDANHANAAGCYLAGLVWYKFLFNESPTKLTFAPPTVPADFAAYLREQAEATEAKVD